MKIIFSTIFYHPFLQNQIMTFLKYTIYNTRKFMRSFNILLTVKQKRPTNIILVIRLVHTIYAHRSAWNDSKMEESFNCSHTRIENVFVCSKQGRKFESMKCSYWLNFCWSYLVLLHLFISMHVQPTAIIVASFNITFSLRVLIKSKISLTAKITFWVNAIISCQKKNREDCELLAKN